MRVTHFFIYLFWAFYRSEFHIYSGIFFIVEDNKILNQAYFNVSGSCEDTLK